MAYPNYDHSGFHRAVVDVHGNYRSQRQAHLPPDELISDVVTARTLRPHLVRSGFFFSLLIVVSLISFLVWIVAAIVAAANTNPFTGETSSEGSAMLGLAYLMLFVQFAILVVWIIALFLPLREPIAEYGLLIEERAGAYAVSYAWISNTIQNRKSPFRVAFGRENGLPVMHLAHGREHGLVVVSPIGMDLFMGWTMWRARSTVVMIGHLFRDMFQQGLQSDVRAASTRAMRELIHSVTREGVQAAILQPPVSDEVARAQIDRLPRLDVAGGGPTVTHSPQFQPAQYSPTGAQHAPSSAPPAQ